MGAARQPRTPSELYIEWRDTYVPPNPPVRSEEVAAAETAEVEARAAHQEAHDTLRAAFLELRGEAGRRSSLRPDGELVMKPTRRLQRLRRAVEDARREADRRGEELRRARRAANRARRAESDGRPRLPADAVPLWPGSGMYYAPGEDH